MTLVGLVGAAAFAGVTHGFTALTSETARREDVAMKPRAVPSLQSFDQAGNGRSMFADLDNVGPEPRVTIVDFAYTRCVSVCSILAGSFRQLQAEILLRHLEGRVRLVTVSFDPAHDTPQAVARYAEQMHADRRVWTLVTPAFAEQSPDLLAAFGIVVVPAPLGQFQHNAAFHVLDARGRLARIVDIDDPLRALDTALSLASPTAPAT